MHDGGEVDVRGAFAMLAVAHMLRLDLKPQLEEGVVDFISRCQTFDGGIAAEPTCEAHGGYTYCGLAALGMVGKMNVLDLPRLVHWLVHRQDAVSGGFCGRTEKLVDGCYSWWQGACFSILKENFCEYLAQTRVPNITVLAPGRNTVDAEDSEVCSSASKLFAANHALSKKSAASMQDSDFSIQENMDVELFLYNPVAQQAWSLICCQDVENGGLKDKPGKPADFYHTCYNLAGLAVAQQVYGNQALGGKENILPRIDPKTCVLQELLQRSRDYFRANP